MRKINFEAELPTELPGSLDKLFLGPLHLFDFLVIGAILFFTVGLWIVGPPLIYDDFYHMATAQQIYLLGYVPTWDFWEFAPVGRPNLYPPLIQVIMAEIMKVDGGDVLLAAKIVKVAIYPLLAFCLWWSTRKFAGYKAAFYTMLVFMGGVTLLAEGYEILPLTIVIALSCVLFWTFTQKKLITSIILLSVSLWLHLSMPLLIVAVLAVFSIIRRHEGYLPFFAKVAGVSLLLYSPWLIHILGNLKWLAGVVSPLGLFIPLLIWIVGLPGTIYMVKYYKNNSFIFFLLAVALVPMFISYGNLFWVYILIPFSFFAGITVSKFIGSRKGRWKKANAVLIVILALSSITFAPVVGESLDVFIHSLNSPPFLYPSAPYYLASWPSNLMGLTPINYDPTGNIDPVGNIAFYYLASLWISVNTQPYQPICVVGGMAGVNSVMITAFSGRPTTDGSFLEVMNPLIQPIVLSYDQNNATVYVVGPPYTEPPSSAPTKLVAEFGPVMIFERT
jgi:hypothetical protein